MIKGGLLFAFKLNAIIKYTFTIVGFGGLGLTYYLMKNFPKEKSNIKEVTKKGDDDDDDDDSSRGSSANSEKFKY